MAEGARLESVYTGNRIVGSNPTPSAKVIRRTVGFMYFLIANFDLPILLPIPE